MLFITIYRLFGLAQLISYIGALKLKAIFDGNMKRYIDSLILLLCQRKINIDVFTVVLFLAASNSGYFLVHRDQMALIDLEEGISV